MATRTPLTPPFVVDPPDHFPTPYGLFSTFSFRAARPDGRWENGITWVTEICDALGGIPHDCGGSFTMASPSGSTVAVAQSFTVTGSYGCRPTGGIDASAQATRNLLNREEARVEKALWTGDLGNTPNLKDSAHVLTAASTDPEVLVGQLEQYLSDHYGGLGVLHVSRLIGEILASRGILESRNGRLFTALGTPVSAGDGNPGTEAKSQTKAVEPTWMFITPPVFGYRSDVFSPPATLDRAQNELTAVSQRTYVLGFDPCGVAAVPYTLPTLPSS